MNCRICGSKTDFSFTSRVLKKHDIKYFLCPNCDFLQTEEPFWLDEAYSSALNIYDTGVMQRNIQNMEIVSPFLYYFVKKDSSFVDYAGGYGIFVRLMRDRGFNFFWTDLYAQNLLAREFEYSESKTYDVLTCFEFFEHAVFPIQEFQKQLNISDNIIFSTLLRPTTIPGPEWWYYGQEHGQHVSFYSLKTLEYIATQLKVNLISNGSDFHVFVKQNSNLSAKKKYIKYRSIDIGIRFSSLKEYNNLSIKLKIKHILGRFKKARYFLPGVNSLTWSDHEQLITSNR